MRFYKAQDGIRVGAVVQVICSFGVLTDTRVVAFFALHVEYDLKMEVRRPLPVFEGQSEFAEHVPRLYMLSLIQIF